MSDKEDRELERRWRASGDDADEARVLTARLRTGRLDPDRVVLAARLEHAPAAQALLEASEDLPLPARLYPAPDLHRAIQKVGPEAAVRMSLVCVTRVRAALRAMRDERVEAVVAGLADWLRCPSPPSRRAVLDARDALEEDVVWEATEELSSDERLLRVAYSASESLLPATGHVTKVIVNGEFARQGPSVRRRRARARDAHADPGVAPSLFAAGRPPRGVLPLAAWTRVALTVATNGGVEWTKISDVSRPSTRARAMRPRS
jgi:hypothetical protein